VNQGQVDLLNSALPANQVSDLGGNLKKALDQFNVRDHDLVRYVDKSVTNTGNGKTRSTAFKRFYEGIEWLNSNSGKGATLIVIPGFYIEAASNIAALSASDCMIKGIGNPDDTVIFGSGTDDTVDAATDDLLTVSGGNNVIDGLSLFVYKNTKSALLTDDTGGGYAGSFNLFSRLFFSRQAADGQKYGVNMQGGNYNTFLNCWWTGSCKDAGVYIASNAGNPSYNRFLNCWFNGTGTDGILIGASAAYNHLVSECIFQAGSYPTGGADSMTNGVHVNASCTAGDIIVANSIFSQAAAAALKDASGGTFSYLDRNNSTG